MSCYRTPLLVVLLIFYGFMANTWAAKPIQVFVSIAPQRYFVQQIGKDMVDVQVMVEPGADPHTYEPKPQQMVSLSKAALYFAVGIEFEKAKLEKISAVNPRMQVVHTDQYIMKLPMAAHGHAHAKDKHGRDHHLQGRLDPHIWLSPPLVMLQARSILVALVQADPDYRLTYETNYRDFILEIVELDAHLRATFTGLKAAAFMVFHPSWGTFAHTYGLQQVPIEIEGKSPKPAQLKRLIQQAHASGIKVVFAQPQFSSKSAQQIARAISGQVAVVDPLAEDWATNLRRIAEEFKHAFK